MIVLTVDEIVLLHGKLLRATVEHQACVTLVCWNLPYWVSTLASEIQNGIQLLRQKRHGWPLLW